MAGFVSQLTESITVVIDDTLHRYAYFLRLSSNQQDAIRYGQPRRPALSERAFPSSVA